LILPSGRSLRATALVAAFAAFGCASHSDKTKAFRTALDAGQPQKALAEVNDMLDVDSAKELPEKAKGDNALLLLDRGMVLQAIDDYKLSSRDLELSDKQIEVLDFSRNAVHDIGKYLFSDDVGPYKAPAYEKLMINTMNMVNYLARGDLQGARIEARRLAVMQKFLGESEGPGRGLLGLGSYLAGFTYEKSGKPDEALRYYDEALAYGDYPSLHEPIRRLARDSGYRSPRIRKILDEPDSSATPAPSSSTPAPARDTSWTAPAPAPAAASGTAAAPVPTPDPAADDSAEILVVIGYGRVPAKIAKRIPIGLALTYASFWMSAANSAQAERLAAQGLVTWINYPELGKPHGAYDTPSVSLDGKWIQLEGGLAVDLEAKRAWDDARGPIVASAITRMIARVIAGEAIRRSAKDSTVGAILSLGTQVALVAADTPDTRSWETLPARVAIARVRVRPGQHRLTLTPRGVRRERAVTLTANGWGFAGLTVLR
jgi:tetratricopeptide (TPR) repeat protein